MNARLIDDDDDDDVIALPMKRGRALAQRLLDRAMRSTIVVDLMVGILTIMMEDAFYVLSQGSMKGEGAGRGEIGGRKFRREISKY